RSRHRPWESSLWVAGAARRTRSLPGGAGHRASTFRTIKGINQILPGRDTPVAEGAVLVLKSAGGFHRFQRLVVIHALHRRGFRRGLLPFFLSDPRAPSASAACGLGRCGFGAFFLTGAGFLGDALLRPGCFSAAAAASPA